MSRVLPPVKSVSQLLQFILLQVSDSSVLQNALNYSQLSATTCRNLQPGTVHVPANKLHVRNPRALRRALLQVNC